MGNAPSLLLDTNVWVDIYDGNRPLHLRAQALLTRAIERDAAIFYAVPTLKDLYYLLSRSLKHRARAEHESLRKEDAVSAESIAWACVENMQDIAAPVAADLSDVWLAGTYRELHRDFEDNLVAAAATRCGADILVTNDEQFLRHCPVRAMDVADTLAYLGLSAYR